MAFWDKDVDKHFGKLEEGMAYVISGADIKKSNNKFNSSGNSYEIVCSKETMIQQADNVKSQEIKKFDINVDTIRSVETQLVNSKLTVLGFALQAPIKEVIKKKDGG